MKTITSDTADKISALVDKWRPILESLSEEQFRFKPTADRWSIAEVIGHLVDSANNNHQRFIRAQRCSELTFPKYDQNHWVDACGYHSVDQSDLIQLWYHYNKIISNVLRRLPADQLKTPCTITPYETCSLEFLVTDYFTHLKHHLEKIHERIR